MNQTKRTFIVGSMPIKHNGQHLPPGADIELTFEEYRSLGLDLEEARGVEISGTIEEVVPLPELHHAPLNVAAEDPAATSAALEAAALALAAEAPPAAPPAAQHEGTEGDAADAKTATDTDTTAGKPGRTKTKGA